MFRFGARALATVSTVLFAHVFFGIGAAQLRAQGEAPGSIDSLAQNLTILQNLDGQVDLGLQFTDEGGQPVRLGKYFGGKKPVVLMLVYYGCPMLCGQVMNGTVEALKQISLEIGSDYDIVSVSIDPSEDHELAAKKKVPFVRLFNREGTEGGWHFLTADSASSAKLAAQVGFKYYYDTKLQQYAHSAGIMVLTPQGKISSYYFGITYDPQDLRLGLVDASDGKIGTLADKAKLAFCYQYDPTTGSYGVAIYKAIRVIGGLMIFTLVGFIFISVRRDRKKKRTADPAVNM